MSVIVCSRYISLIPHPSGSPSVALSLVALRVPQKVFGSWLFT
ncbi:predicted protein [Aspergillus nidulans FGSC A4]|uniref:Uncharacterized protein n=1 Tax=Emericella nidulans (strain FGSC A4 / ATCC 38163 / CBS 112.46 / NRRL 194 / M139) TaxID=227321 RepID=Q5BEA5_EMENI|nr:hypothetical protein [Aspergillus nidulans FGSC A4]EAA66243.1 predicted protein [Aspergillus nidulans FGSC A4]CBF88092.1 TPA: conserved hypothetical protein [Aspergillus nidulans FGSC A4]|eukprot:XP_658729.1 predicted protein [Aspergillus nidulans FGSC A4]